MIKLVTRRTDNEAASLGSNEKSLQCLALRISWLEFHGINMPLTQNIQSRAFILLPVFCAVLLSGCGGGGSGADTVSRTVQSADAPTMTAQATSSATTVPGSWKGRVPLPTIPNTQWTQRVMVVNGQSLTYAFGVGNPTPVALPTQEYLATADKPGKTYVTAETEGNLKQFLADDFLPIFLKNCAADISRFDDEGDAELPNINASSIDINNILQVDESTGRKEIRGLLRLNLVLQRALGNEVVGVGFGYKCLSPSDFNRLGELKRKFSKVAASYYNTYQRK